MRIDPDWLEEGEDTVTCPVCTIVLDHPVTGCPEGHALCRDCYVQELSQRKRCPTCRHPVELTQLQRCRPLEELIGRMKLCCKHGADDGEGGGGEGAPALVEGGERCIWRGRVSELAGHLADCGYEPVE